MLNYKFVFLEQGGFRKEPLDAFVSDMAYATMPVKNNLAIYESIFRYLKCISATNCYSGSLQFLPHMCCKAQMLCARKEGSMRLITNLRLITRVYSITIIRANLSEPHTSGSALHRCTCIRPCLLAAIYSKL